MQKKGFNIFGVKTTFNKQKNVKSVVLDMMCCSVILKFHQNQPNGCANVKLNVGYNCAILERSSLQERAHVNSCQQIHKC